MSNLDSLHSSVVAVMCTCIFLSIGYGANITCADNEDCVINCTTTDCYAGILTGTNANSLNVLCNGVERCAYSTIYCPVSNGSICNIQCIGDSNCKYFEVHADFNNISIECNGKYACNKAKIRATYATSYNMICLNDVSPYYWNAPCGTDIGFVNFRYAHKASIQCLTQYACYFAQWYGEYVVDEVTLTCVGDNSCHAIDLYCPAATSNQCQISCEGSACFDYAQVNTRGVTVTDYLNLTCLDPPNCDGLRVSCDIGSWVTANFDALHNEYVCSSATHSCCPWDTASPTLHPIGVTKFPSITPTNIPTVMTQNPSMMPTISPTSNPSNQPSTNPSMFPTGSPTFNPTDIPTKIPSMPSISPTRLPSRPLTAAPTFNPTERPSFQPTMQPLNGHGASNDANSQFYSLALRFVIFCVFFF